MKLLVPEMLKVLLVDDWENITKNNQVCPASLLSSGVDLLMEFTPLLKSRSWFPCPGLLMSTNYCKNSNHGPYRRGNNFRVPRRFFPLSLRGCGSTLTVRSGRDSYTDLSVRSTSTNGTSL